MVRQITREVMECSPRASYTDREKAVSVLRNGYCLGMISLDELEDRAAEAYQSPTISSLEGLVRDLVIGHPEATVTARAEPEVILAGVLRRLSALTIDWVILSAGGAVLGMVNPLLAVFGLALYFPVLWLVRFASVGQLAVGIRVVDARTGGRIEPLQAVVRFAALCLAAPYLVCILPLFWDPERQGWHDRIARTVVVRRRSTPASGARSVSERLAA